MDTDSLDIAVRSHLRNYKVDSSQIKNLMDDIGIFLGLKGHQLSIEFVNSKRIRSLNKEFRNKDKATDVLSFPQIEWESPHGTNSSPITVVNDFAPPHLGDIVISLPEAEKNAEKIGHDLDREVIFLLIHGLLHLCGHDHHEPEEDKIMQQEQTIILQYLKQQGPPPVWLNCATKRIKS